jgi:hypothetical protein
MVSKSEAAWIADFLPCDGGWFLLWFCLVWMIGCPQKFLDDGAVARHVVTGRDILVSGHIAHTNYVWAINPQAPWLTHELLGDLVLGGGYLLGGLNAVSAIGIVVTGLALMWCFQIARHRGLGRISGWLFLAPVVLATSLHWLSRSHIFSYLFLLIIYYLTFVSSAPFRWRLIVSCAVMGLWSNFHGSVGLGLFILMLKPACLALEALFTPEWKQKTKAISLEFLIPLGGLIATAFNVRGLSFFSYLIGYVSNPGIMGKGGEWRSIDFSFSIGVWCFVLVFCLLVLLWSYSPKRPQLSEVVLCLVLFVSGLYAMRLEPCFALLALPAMGPPWAAIREQLLSLETSNPPMLTVQKLLRWDENKVQTPSQQLKQAGLRTALLAVLVSVFLVAPTLAVKDFPKTRLPVAALDYMTEHKIGGLGFYFDNWGPYVYLRLGQPIFIDDKTDFYPQWFMKEYFKGYEGGDTAVLDKYKVSYVLVPPNSPMAVTLRGAGGWSREFEDKTAVLFVIARPINS